MPDIVETVQHPEISETLVVAFGERYMAEAVSFSSPPSLYAIAYNTNPTLTNPRLFLEKY